MDILSRLKGANPAGPQPEVNQTTNDDHQHHVSVSNNAGCKEATTIFDDVLKSSSVLRRRSTFKGLATSIQKAIAFKKLAKTNSVVDIKPTINYQNTFKMEPDNTSHFNADKIQKVILCLLESTLSSDKYDSKKSSFMTRRITEMVKNKVKQMNFPRYKLVCNVMLGQCNDQGLEAVSRCVWDSRADGFACIHYKNDTLFVVVTVYGVYFE